MKARHIAVAVVAAHLLVAAGFGLIVLFGSGCQSSDSGSQQAANPPAMPPSSSEVQKATIVVDNGFSPASVEVKAGQPVELTFDTKHRSCATKVIFKDLGIEKTLEDGKQTVVTFTPKASGTIAYACPMDMFKGEVIAK